MNNHQPYHIKDQSLFVTRYPKSFSEQRMNDIAELLRTIEIDTMEFYSHDYPENKIILKLSNELFNAMNKSMIKLSKCNSYRDVYQKLFMIMQDCVNEKRPGFGSEINPVATSFERSEILYANK